MKSQHHNTINSSQWQAYKALELIPDSTPNPQTNQKTLTFGLDRLWQLMLDTFTREMLYEQQIEHLERCWALNAAEWETTSTSNGWQKLWWNVLTR